MYVPIGSLLPYHQVDVTPSLRIILSPSNSKLLVIHQETLEKNGITYSTLYIYNIYIYILEMHNLNVKNAEDCCNDAKTHRHLDSNLVYDVSPFRNLQR